MKFKVVLTRQAERDVDGILNWLNERSPSGARRWFEALERALDWLEVHSSTCAKAPESDEFPIEIRQFLFKTRRGRPYRILFSIDDSEARVLHIRGPGQDLVRPGA